VILVILLSILLLLAVVVVLVLGGSGGSGIVVVRYQIGQLTAVAKATGGAISYYSGKTIHTFTSSGTFATAPNWTAATVEYVVIGGGGGASSDSEGDGGGGGAGGYYTSQRWFRYRPHRLSFINTSKNIS
jgi:hypothetical protein